MFFYNLIKGGASLEKMNTMNLNKKGIIDNRYLYSNLSNVMRIKFKFNFFNHL
ncbi:hypothetical protein DFP96_101101 [Listeria rocourtiae]|uniref:Uncharacterized protein n=1 Tax=Listeria rocourtiae TaxID=647910 RepID=A0A4R6ZRX2_9LIST|nr:hypothetical protein DFP96_101101 [Listeria rocourtiae]